MRFTSFRSSFSARSLHLVLLVVAAVQSEVAANQTIRSQNADEQHNESLTTTLVASVLDSEPTGSSVSETEKLIDSIERQQSTRSDSPGSDESLEQTPSHISEAAKNLSSSNESDQPNGTETTPTTTTTTSLEGTTTLAKECEIECLNDGVCRILPDGSEKCFCKDAFWGVRCQLRNICKSIIVENMTGEDICRRIGRYCIIDDKLFRCQCDSNEFFIFKPDHLRGQNERDKSDNSARPSGGAVNPQELSTFVYDSLLTASMDKQTTDETETANKNIRTSHLAECRKVDKCLGVRCRQRSEVCQEGQCVCNRNLGFIRDPRDKLCKLLNPCNMPAERPICGEARCLPTYNQELYKCVCPIGYYALASSSESHTIKCAVLQYHPASSIVCLVPLLNQCQHKCQLHDSSYKCSCFDGYRPGKRPGIDDHLCFFKDYIGDENEDEADDDSEAQDGFPPRVRRQITFEPIKWEGERFEKPKPAPRSASGEPFEESHGETDMRVQRKVMMISGSYPPLRRPRSVDEGQTIRESNVIHESDSMLHDQSMESGDLEDSDDNHKFMSAQERCNIFCDENKICVLEDEATGIYRCICDRQGYVSVGDKCLDWCSTAEFSHTVRFLLEMTCATGLCKRRPDDRRPPSNQMSSFYRKTSFLNDLNREQQDLVRLVATSSWRPSFQCDCSTSPLVYEDPQSRLCQLNFSSILEPCLPGNEGHTDCVVNKHAYCAVLHKDPLLQSRGMTMGQLIEHMKSGADSAKLTPDSGQKFQHQGAKTSATGTSGAGSGAAAGKKAKPVKDKPYVCVCSPEKKFLVDKPRNKARCVDECDLLSNECGRFNRMCRAATVNSNELFGLSKSGLVREDQDGVRMDQFKRTGCECLPGFNVGPTEPRDFTLDSNYPNEGDDVSGQLNGDNQATGCSRGCAGANSNQRPFRFSWDLLESLLMDANFLINKNPPAMEHSVIQDEFVAVGQDIEHLKTRYMNINSRCLLDYDVVEFHARFKAPADFEPSWVDWARVRPAADNENSSKSVPAQIEQPTQTSANSLDLAAPSNNSIESVQPADSANEPEKEVASGSARVSPRSSFDQGQKLTDLDKILSGQLNANELLVPKFMRADMADFYKHVVLVADCEFLWGQKSFVAYEQCLRYRYWIVQKFRAHFADWRSVISNKLKETFDLMDGKIRFRVNKCETIIKRVSSVPEAYAQSRGEPKVGSSGEQQGEMGHEEVEIDANQVDPWDHFARVDADLDCKLTIHSASDYDSHGARKTPKRVLLEKQLPKFIFNVSKLNLGTNPKPDERQTETPQFVQTDYYMMAPNALIHHESYDQLAAHRKAFSPCNSEYSYCDKQTRCEMQDVVNYSCTCEAGYTPIGSRDIYFQDSRKEVCEDINECLFDVCKGNGLEDKSVCVNEIGDYKCQCIRHHVGDNKRFCDHICNVIACKHGDCRIPDEHHAFCECYEGYREADCSVQDPSVALRKANMIICSSIFASVLLLAITLAISLNSQLKKTKKKLKRLEAAQEAVEFYEFSLQQPPFRHRVSKASITS